MSFISNQPRPPQISAGERYRYDWPLILAYHSISKERQDGLALHPADFEGHLRWLAEQGYRSLPLSEYMHRPADPGKRPPKHARTVFITFDDGYADNYSQAFPLLKRYGFDATIFLVAGYVDQEHVFWWDLSKVNASSERRLFHPLSWRQIHEMAEYGIEFGSHTSTHPRGLTELAPERCWQEVSGSRETLERHLGTRIVSFCYPRGDLNEAVMQTVARAGYECAVVTPPRYGIPITRYTLRRVSLYREYSQWQFRFMTTRLFRRNYEHFKRLRRALRKVGPQ